MSQSAEPDVVALSAVELSRRIRDRDISCAEVMAAYLDWIDEYNSSVNAIVALRPRSALLAEALERDHQLASGDYLGWMHGLPHAVKDLLPVKGLPFTAGSPIFAGRVAEQDAIPIARIRAAGAIFIGKTNTPEFGLGSQTYNDVWGITANPYDPSLTAGGSSGGAAAAVALRLLPVADGTDYMGSLRNPPAFTNTVGFRPSWGRVPEPGFVAQGSVTGPIARSVGDLTRLLATMAGVHRRWPLGIAEDPAALLGALDRDFRGTRVAWVGDWDGHLAMEPGILAVCDGALQALRGLGCVVEAYVPDFDPSSIWESFLTWRWWRNLRYVELYDNAQTREKLKPEMQWEIEHGLTLSGADMMRADVVRNGWYAALATLFDRYDFVVAPSTQVFPFDKSVHWPTRIAGRPMDTYHRWMETVVPWTLATVPVAAVPAGFGPAGLPTGVQLIGRRGADRDVLELAYAYEQATHWVSRVPPRPGAGGSAAR